MCPGGVPTRATARVRALWRPSPRRWWATAWQKASERGRKTARTGDLGDVVVLLPAAGPDRPRQCALVGKEILSTSSIPEKYPVKYCSSTAKSAVRIT